mmetsp:Transcript_28657/g.50983  ORF Transcript_28657/g.50983 Transcript_28657/m.50983 type:complete len:665 (-) Transcript_28657:118-2112(-)
MCIIGSTKMEFDVGLLAASFSAILGIKIVERIESVPYALPFSIAKAHSALIHHISTEESPTNSDSFKRFRVSIVNVMGRNFEVEVHSMMSVQELKQRASNVTNFPEDFQSITYKAHTLDDNNSLGSYGIDEASVLYLVLSNAERNRILARREQTLQELRSHHSRMASTLNFNIPKDSARDLRIDDSNALEEMLLPNNWLASLNDALANIARNEAPDEDQLHDIRKLAGLVEIDAQSLSLEEVVKQLSRKSIEVLCLMHLKAEEFPTLAMKHYIQKGLRLSSKPLALLRRDEDGGYYLVYNLIQRHHDESDVYLKQGLSMEIMGALSFLEGFDASLLMKAKEASKIVLLSIELSTGALMDVETRATDEVIEVKREIGKRTKLLLNQIILIKDREALDDHRTLRSYGLSSGSELYCSLSLRGGSMVTIRSPNGLCLNLALSRLNTVNDLKKSIKDLTNIPKFSQILVADGKVLDCCKSLKDNKVGCFTDIWLLTPDDMPIFYIDPADLDPAFNYDFTAEDDSNKAFTRGGRKYERPIGWKRYALKVAGKYENDEWLGIGDSPEVWPVSYHGTKVSSIESIAAEGYDLKKGKRFMYGKGIYSTPNLLLTKGYQEEFEFNGSKYVVVLQNRVNLQQSKEKIFNDGSYFITPNDKDIRPYGVLIKTLKC